MKRVLGLIMALTFLSVGPQAIAAEKETPATIAGAATVDSKTVKKWLDAGENMVILDPRKESDYKEKGHIPTAINCPVNTDTDLTDKVIADAAKHLSECASLKGVAKTAKIVAYCNGPACWMSPKAIAALHKMGYSNLLWFRGGMKDWKSDGFPTE